MNKAFKIMELLWLGMGCVGVLMCAYSIVAKDSRSAIYFLVLTFAGGLMYSVRRRQRIKHEEGMKQKQQSQEIKK